jgi:hypothetical protein
MIMSTTQTIFPAYRTEAVITNDGTLTLNELPFSVGENLEVILVKLSSPPQKRQAGMDAGKIWMAPDFDEPLPDDILDAFEGKVE